MFESTWQHKLSSKELWCLHESISPSREPSVLLVLCGLLMSAWWASAFTGISAISHTASGCVCGWNITYEYIARTRTCSMLKSCHSPESSLSGITNCLFSLRQIYCLRHWDILFILLYINKVILMVLLLAYWLCWHLRTMLLFRRKSHSDIIIEYEHKYIA